MASCFDSSCTRCGGATPAIELKRRDAGGDRDNAGNTTSDSTGYTATYDLSGRLATLTKAGTITTYSYDNNGLRIRKVGSSGAGSTVVFVYDQGGHLLGEYDQAGGAIREYVWFGDTPVAVITPDPASNANPPLVFLIHTDHLDTPRVVVDKSNNVRWRWMTELFGTNAPESSASNLGAFVFNLRMPDQYADQESGLVYDHNRTLMTNTAGCVRSCGRYAVTRGTLWGGRISVIS